MTQDVDPETYYAVGKGLFDKAGKLYDAFAVNVNILGETGSMAGSDDAGTAWATSYDERASEVLGAANDLVKALENYGGVIIQAGYNHAVAEHNSTPGNQAPMPSKPADPATVDGTLTAPPSAGGPGEGLLDDSIGLVSQLGVPVPDGDTDKVAKAADAWDRLATVYQTKTIVEGLDVDARTFSDTHSPEVEYIVRDLGELRDAASAVLNGCAELSESCREYKSALEDLRTQLEDILEELAKELAVTAAIAVAASFVSFGVGAVAGTAKAAHSITKYARMITGAIASWKLSKNISKGVQKVHDIAGVRQKLQRIKNLGRKEKPDEKPPAPPRRDPEFDFNTRPERLDHTFAEKHKLAGVVERAGGREEAMRQILDGLKGHVPNQGTFETVVNVTGENVTVRGFVDNGVVKISTAFIP
ncbi:hypothetical protein ACQI4L_14135 [Mycolicibacterium litorale]|uniref:WXG100-like domain-containing protein n=1 Tax=Mycolicibacterium litorale TaxID=758802 RepID=UPI003CF0987B